MRPAGASGPGRLPDARSLGVELNVSECVGGESLAADAQCSMPQRGGPTRKRVELGRGGRILAAALAAIWLAAGLTALAIGVWLRPAIVPVLVSPFALGYGWIWARVAVTGRRQEWPPWRGRQQRR
jgi:hypothetical protein